MWRRRRQAGNTTHSKDRGRARINLSGPFQQSAKERSERQKRSWIIYFAEGNSPAHSLRPTLTFLIIPGISQAILSLTPPTWRPYVPPLSPHASPLSSNCCHKPLFISIRTSGYCSTLIVQVLHCTKIEPTSTQTETSFGQSLVDGVWSVYLGWWWWGGGVNQGLQIDKMALYLSWHQLAEGVKGGCPSWPTHSLCAPWFYRLFFWCNKTTNLHMFECCRSSEVDSEVCLHGNLYQGYQG